MTEHSQAHPHADHEQESGASAHEDEHHGHTHGHGHDHDHGEHGHSHPTGFKGSLYGIFVPHSHDGADSIDDAMEAHSEGIRELKISLVLMLATTVLQAVVVAFSGSVALLADTIHNLSDALTAVPLWIAFVLSRRVATRKYTYGFNRAEVESVERVRMRWVGHRLHGDALVRTSVTSLADADRLAAEAESSVRKHMPNVDEMAVRVTASAVR